LGKLLKHNHRPAKLSYSFSSRWRKNSGELKILPLPKAKGSRSLLLGELSTTVCRGASLRAVIMGAKTRARAAQFPGHRIAMRAPNDRGGRQKVLTMSQVLQCSTFASERPQVRTWGRQTCFLPRAPSNLVMPLAVIQYSSALSMYMEWGVAQLVQARTQGGGCRECTPPPDLKRCWHDTWFHWKSSPKIFLYCTLKINLC